MTTDDQTARVAALQAATRGFLPELLGVTFVEATPERVVGTLAVRDDLCTIPGVLHGGAIMAFADTLGAFATAQHLVAGQGTTTIESKTNFLSAGRTGDTVRGECTSIHRGRRTMVWQTRVTSGDGKLIALTTQTQMILEAR